MAPGSNPRTRRTGRVAVAILCACMVARAFVSGVTRDLGPPVDREGILIPLRLDPARCSWRDLTVLPGLGEARARVLWTAWRRRGPLSRGDLRSLPGFGEETVEGLRDFLRVAEEVDLHGR